MGHLQQEMTDCSGHEILLYLSSDVQGAESSTHVTNRSEKKMKWGRFPTWSFSPLKKLTSGALQKTEEGSPGRGSNVGIFGGSAEACPCREEASSAGDPKSSTGQPDSGAEEREVWPLPYGRPRGGGPGLLGDLETSGWFRNTPPGIGPTGEPDCFPVHTEKKLP